MPNEPSLWDLQRLIERNHTDAREDILDLKTQMATAATHNDERFRLYLLREVYEARETARDAIQTAMQRRITELEEARRTDKSQVRVAILAALASVVATVVAAVILALVLKGGKP